MAGVGSAFPGWSRAATLKTCLPSERFVTFAGLVHAFHERASSLQRKVASGSEEKANRAECLVIRFAGPDSLTVWGGVVSASAVQSA